MSKSSHAINSALFSVNAEYIADLYARYLKSPSAVEPSWRSYFDSLNAGDKEDLRQLARASWGDEVPPLFDDEYGTVVAKAEKKAQDKGLSAEQVKQAAQDSIRALMLIRSFRDRGHLMANLDPLGLMKREPHPELTPEYYGFSQSDYGRQIYVNGVLGLETTTLPELLERLTQTYCDNIGVEYTHIQDIDQKRWIEQRIESGRNATDFTAEGKRAILQRLTAAECFEKFLHVKYPGTKRFGLDGGEAMIPAIEQIMKRGGQLGLEEVVLGMAHRGRLNVLTNVMQKSFTAMFSEFQGRPSKPNEVQGSGDVKYHMGTSSDRDFDGNTIHLSLTANPSHLEAVNPVVAGKVRAKQLKKQDKSQQKVLPLLLHGDAAFAGQGLVAETLMMSELPGYSVGGTIHIVINNQIGFTTSPLVGRSGPYSTDVAKMVQAPIFHVNGDDAEAVVHVARIATEYRQQFNKDVVIDMYCYRRFGHNEGDEPAFTQPLMYEAIGQKTPVRQIYANTLASEGVLSLNDADKIVDDFNHYLEEQFAAADHYNPNEADMLQGAWSGLDIARELGPRRGRTAVSEDVLQRVGKALTKIPAGFNLNSKIARQFKAKEDMFKTGEGFDWATAEALAFGTLLEEGFDVRLSGQDVERGTFSHRHAVLTDQKTEGKYISLSHISEEQARFQVYNSPLSEFAVLGFEYGYALADPKALVLWEAQFGDFVNGAQVIIDQFISSGETKWLRMNGLVMLLPHGSEGQGPEHSSARPERFLQSCAEDNMQVVNCTTPANYFHALRRQLHRNFRKPLIVMSPKSLLRHKLCVSPKSMFLGDETFHRVLYEDVELAKPKDIKRVVLCTGKVYYDLFQEREARGLKNVTMLRLEQIYPFPDDALAEELKKYPNADVVWCQEEPENQGYWHFVDRRIENVLTAIGHKTKRPRYVGRPDAAAPATGLLKQHNIEQAKLVDEALTV